MLTDQEIQDINNILIMLGFDTLSSNEIEYLNLIYGCNAELTPPCDVYNNVGKVLSSRGDVCIENQVNKLQDISNCEGCDIDFISWLLKLDTDNIWIGDINDC